MTSAPKESVQFTLAVKESVQQARRELWPAFKKAWFYVGIGVLIGFVLLFLAYGLKHWEWLINQIGHAPVDFLDIVFEHLGIGFIVSALAVFFYEWGAHIKKAMELIPKLAKAIDDVELIKTNTERGDVLVDTIKQASYVLEMAGMSTYLQELNSAAGRRNLGLSLKTLIGGYVQDKPEYVRDAISTCETLVRVLERLHNDKAWANDRYLDFIVRQIKTVVVKNAEAFTMLRRSGEQHFNVPPNAAEMADDILASQMQAMSKPDVYDVLSDLTSWRAEQLQRFHDETKIAIEERGVHVRRIFNLLRESEHYHDATALADFKQVLVGHIEASRSWTSETGEARYEVRIVGQNEYKNLKKKQPKYTKDEIIQCHFGLFNHDQVTVSFNVTKIDLSDMALSRDPSVTKPKAKVFAHVWEVALDPLRRNKTGGIPSPEDVKEEIDQILEELK